ncbi:Uncharacterised protein [Vibrio cholerae]|nr:Uncharacterised protein [Vibrio cholerae]
MLPYLSNVFIQETEVTHHKPKRVIDFMGDASG